jgi:hypothetical protein
MSNFQSDYFVHIFNDLTLAWEVINLRRALGLRFETKYAHNYFPVLQMSNKMPCFLTEEIIVCEKKRSSSQKNSLSGTAFTKLFFLHNARMGPIS